MTENRQLPFKGHSGAGPRRKPNWELLVFAIPFSCFALYMSYGFYQSYLEQQDASSFFEPVSARIVSTMVESTMHQQPDVISPTHVHQPRILYEYKINDRLFQSRRFSYFGDAYSSHDEAKAVVERYPVGTVQTAYFNPNDPAEAVLSKVRPTAWWRHFWFPAIFVTVGLLGIFGGWRGWLRKSE